MELLVWQHQHDVTANMSESGHLAGLCCYGLLNVRLRRSRAPVQIPQLLCWPPVRAALAKFH